MTVNVHSYGGTPTLIEKARASKVAANADLMMTQYQPFEANCR
jgi:hypothetical protein